MSERPNYNMVRYYWEKDDPDMAGNELRKDNDALRWALRQYANWKRLIDEMMKALPYD